ncbi:hypothetical protein PPROV_001122400 [Pycnococcus provasolii]|uniref:Uncharacterized protein n=1 Tax=Pycnococcus provasolii TaxID=41880 RepID=A0A830HYF6_9CHLO|nr:hypothetical protein PPROV_001122400 [Pycnococcus provasolii]
MTLPRHDPLLRKKRVRTNPEFKPRIRRRPFSSLEEQLRRLQATDRSTTAEQAEIMAQKDAIVQSMQQRIATLEQELQDAEDELESRDSQMERAQMMADLMENMRGPDQDGDGAGGGGAGGGGGTPHPLFSKIRNGRVDEVESNLRDGTFPQDARDQFGNTMLIVACQNNRKRIAKMALRYGVNPNATNLQGKTALHYCREYGYDDLGDYLLSKGAHDMRY